jgi:hypothetical protein
LLCLAFFLWPSHRIRWLLINLTIFFPLITSSNSSWPEGLYQWKNPVTQSGIPPISCASCPGIGLSIVVCIVSYCMLWIFPAGKIRRASVGSETAILGTRGQHANPYTTEAANRTRDLPVCSAVPQPLRHRVPRATQVKFLSK